MLFLICFIFPLNTLVWNWRRTVRCCLFQFPMGSKFVPVQHFNGENSAATARRQLSPPAVRETVGKKYYIIKTNKILYV